MKVLAINSSARRDGNTAILIHTVLEELSKEGIEAETIQLSGKTIEPCKACWACGGQKNCVHQNDLFQKLFEKMLRADGKLLGSPVYTANISANMQAFLERAPVVAARRGGALNALDAMHHFYMSQNVFIVGSSYWPMAYGQLPGEVQQDEEGLNTMKALGQNMAYLLKKLKAGLN